MSDRMRWRYGDTNPVVAAVGSATVIEIGDLLWQDGDEAKPASMVNDRVLSLELGTSVVARPEQLQELFADKFLGVAMERSRYGDTMPIRVATTGVFEFDCPSETFRLGDLLGVRFLDSPLSNESEPQDRPIRGLANQKVQKVAKSTYAIGRCAKRQPTPVTSVYVDIRSTVMTGGVAGSSPTGV